MQGSLRREQARLQVTSNISVGGLHTVDNCAARRFHQLERLDLSGVNYHMIPDRLDIDQVTARKLYARVIVEQDTSLNVKRVLEGPGATVVSPALPPGGKPVAVTADSNPKAGVDARGQANRRTYSASSRCRSPSRKSYCTRVEANLRTCPCSEFRHGYSQHRRIVLGLSSKAIRARKWTYMGAVNEFSPVAITGESMC